MFRLLKLFIILAALTGLGLWGGNAFAATKTSVAAGGNWNTPATWIPSGVPAAGDTVIIAAGPGAVAVNTNVTQTAAGSVTVNAGATLNATSNDITFGALTIASGGTFTVSRVLTVLGNTDVTGTINLSGRRANIFTGNVTLNSGSSWTNTTTSTQTFSGDFTNNAATFSATGSGGYTFNGAGHTLSGATVTAIPTVTFSNNYTNSGTLSVSGTLTVTGASIRLTNNGTITATASLTGTGGVTQGTNATLNLGGTTTITTLIANAVGNTVNYNGATQTVDTPAPATYYNLTLSGGSGTKTMPALAVTGNFTISSGVTVNATAALTVGGNWIEGGTFNPGTQTVTLNGAAAQTISGTVAFYRLTVTNGTNPNITLATNVSVTNTLTGTVNLTSTCPIDYTLVSATPNQTLHSCPGAVNASTSTVVANPTSVAADNLTTSTITVTLKTFSGAGVAGKTVTLAAGSGSSTISVASGVSSAGGVVTFTVKDGTAEGPITYTATDTTDAIVVTQTASVTFTRLTAPTVLKSFSPTPMGVNGTSTLTITITNPNTGAINGLAFTDNYPSANLKNAAPPVAATSCGGGTVTAVAGASTLSLSGGSLAGPAATSCTVTVNVTSAVVAAYNNSTGAVTSTNANSGTAATGTLTVRAVSPSLSTVVASPTGILADGIMTSTITVTLRDGAGTPVAGKTVTLAAGSGSSIISAASGASSAGGVVTFTVRDSTIEGPITYTATDTTDSNLVITQTAQVTFTGLLNCTSNATGNWSASGTWTNCRNGIPLAGDAVTILAAHTVTLNTTTPVLGNLSNAGTLSASGSNTLNIGGNFTNTGTTSLGSSIVNLKGDFANSNGANFNLGSAETGTWNFVGTALQNINSSGILTTFPNLVLNNSFGIALNASATIKTLLTLTNGYISTGGNILILSANCTDISSTNGTSWVRTNGFVAGNLRLKFPGGATTCTYPVGSGANYAQIVLTTPSGSASGVLTGSTTGNEHPDVANSPVDPNKDINRYWTLSDDTIGASPYNATFWFVTGDVDVGASPGGFVLGRYASSVWTTPASPTPFTNSITASLTGPIVGATDFVAGEASFKCLVPSGSPAGTTCVCDNFSRTSLNPSTIYGGNWNVSSQGTTPFLPQIVANRLRLTSNNTQVSSAATGPGAFPAAGNWVSVEFRHYAYGGTGADGIAFTLSDSSITAVPGSFGGSLGYAQRTGTNSHDGFTGGWVGIGIDEYGNYSSNTEGRAGVATPPPTAPGLTPDSVAVRGSGSGSTGYPYLGGTGTLTPPIDAPSPATDGFGYAYRLKVDARNYTWNGVSGTKTAIISLDRDTTGSGASYSPLMTPFDAYVVNPAQAVVPADWQLSFTGSTGDSTNIHEIVGLKICAQTYVPPAGYRIDVDNDTPTTCPSDPQPTVTISALNVNGQVITTYTNTVTLSATLLGGGASSATWASQGTNTGSWDSVNKRYTFGAGDHGQAKFTLSDLVQQNVYITVTEYTPPGTLTSSSAAPVKFNSGAASFVVSTPDSLGTGVVAGRAHLMRISRNKATCGGGTDAAYTGVKPLDGWYDPATEHPGGAYAPQVCAPVSGACLPSYGTCKTLSIAAPVVDPSSNNLSLTFANGAADFCLVTSDVGKYSLGLRDDSTATGTPAVTGTSVTLTARPFAVVVSGMTGNPAGTTDTDPVFTSAGSPFPATVGGYLWSSSADTGANGLPGNVDLGTTTAAGLAPHYADTVTLAADTSVAGNFAPVAPPATQGSLSSSSVTVSGGSGSSSTLAYSEVGSFTLKATPTSSYLNSGVDLGPRVAIFSNPASASQNKWVGRFKPHHFTLFADTRTNRAAGACSPAAIFTYLDEGLDLTFTLSAEAKGGWTTTNYVGYYAKLVPTLFSNYAVGVRSGTTNLTPRMSGAIIGTPAWAAGVLSAAVARVTVAARSVLPSPLLDGPWASTQFGMAPIDSDGTQLPATALNLDVDNNATFDHQTVGATTELRFGRLRLLNAFGSERMALPMSWETQYWNGEAFVRNAQDGCTSLLPANITMGMYTAPPNPGPTVLSASNLSTVTVNPITAGLGTLTLAPTANATGSVAVVVNLGNGLAGPSDGGNCTSLIATPSIVAIASGTPNPTSSARPYLNGKWCGSGSNSDQDPFARASFGVYKSPIIYRRENY